jgi:hypothetical protein
MARENRLSCAGVPAGNLVSGGGLTGLGSPLGDDAIYFYPDGVMAMPITTLIIRAGARRSVLSHRKNFQ